MVHAPPQIIDEDTWLVIEQPDAEGSDTDSENSNAEGFYAHDYPGAPLGEGASRLVCLCVWLCGCFVRMAGKLDCRAARAAAARKLAHGTKRRQGAS